MKLIEFEGAQYEFPDDSTDQEILNFFGSLPSERAETSPASPPLPDENPREHGLLERAARHTSAQLVQGPVSGFVSSFGATTEGMGRLMQWVGADGRPAEGLVNWGRQISALSERIAPPPEYQNIGTDLTTTVGSFLSYMLPGFAAARLTSTLGRGAQIGAGYGAAVGMAAPAGVAEAYGRAEAFGLEHEEALRTAPGGAAAGAVQVAPLAYYLRGLPPHVRGEALAKVRHVALAAIQEFTVEGAGAVIQNFVERSYNPSRGVWDDAPYQAFIGGGAGAIVAAGTLALTRGRGAAPNLREERIAEQQMQAAVEPTETEFTDAPAELLERDFMFSPPSGQPFVAQVERRAEIKGFENETLYQLSTGQIMPEGALRWEVLPQDIAEQYGVAGESHARIPKDHVIAPASEVQAARIAWQADQARLKSETERREAAERRKAQAEAARNAREEAARKLIQGEAQTIESIEDMFSTDLPPSGLGTPQLSLKHDAQAAQQDIIDTIQQELRRIAPTANVHTFDSLAVDTEGAVHADPKQAEDMRKIGGFHAQNLIGVALDSGGENPLYNAYHEAFHHLRENNFFSPEEIAVLEAEAPQLRSIAADVLQQAPDSPQIANLSQQEIEAYAAGAHAQRRHAGDTSPQPFNISQAATRALDKVHNFFKQVRNALRGLGFSTSADIFEQVYQGRVGQRVPANFKPDPNHPVVQEEQRQAAELLDTSDKEFAQWFGNSKVVDVKTGAPRAVFQGTPNGKINFARQNITDSDPVMGPHTFYFTEDSSAAGFFAQRMAGSRADNKAIIEKAREEIRILEAELEAVESDAWRPRRKNENRENIIKQTKKALGEARELERQAVRYSATLTNPTVASGYVRITNPLYMVDNLEAGVRQAVVRSIEAQRKLPRSVKEASIAAIQNSATLQEAAEKTWQVGPLVENWAARNGYDGLRYEATGLGTLFPHNAWVPFQPDQVRDQFRGGIRTAAELRRAAAQGSKAMHKIRKGKDAFSNETDLGWYGFHAMPPRHLAQRWADFGPVFQAVAEKRETRSTEIVEFSNSVLNIGQASEIDASQVFKALELARLQGLRLEPINGQIVVVNDYADLNHADHRVDSKKGDVITLTPAQTELYLEEQQAMMQAMERFKAAVLEGDEGVSLPGLQIDLAFAHEALSEAERDVDSLLAAALGVAQLVPDAHTRQHIENNVNRIGSGQETVLDIPGIDFKFHGALRGQDMRTLADAFAMLTPLYNDTAMMEQQVAHLRELASQVHQIEAMAQFDYVPFTRFGDFGVSFRHAETNEPLHFETFDGVIGRTRWGKPFKQMSRGRIEARLKEIRAHLKTRYTPEEIVESPIFRLTYENVRRQVGDPVMQFDMLVSMLSDADKESYAKIRGRVAELIKKQGFPAHLLRPMNVPGYNTDLKRALGAYGAGISAHIASQRHDRHINDKLKAISTGTPSLMRYARDYVDYNQSAQEEFGFARGLTFTWFLGFNVSSAAIQLASVPLFAVPRISQLTNMRNATKEATKSFAQINTMIGRSMVKAARGEPRPDMYVTLDPTDPRVTRNLTLDEREALLNAWEAGHLKPLLTLEQAGVAPMKSALAPQTAGDWQKFQDIAASLFNLMETTGRMTTFLAAYRAAKQPGALAKWEKAMANNPLWQTQRDRTDFDPALNVAKWIVDDTFGVFGKGNRPRLMRGFGAWMFQFSHYPWTIVNLLAIMGKQEGASGRKAAAYAAALLILSTGLLGLPLAEDGEEIISRLVNIFRRNGINLRFELEDLIMESTGSARLADAVMSGSIRSELGIDISRRIGLGNMPFMDVLKALSGVRGDVSDALGIPGSLIWGNAETAFRRHRGGFHPAESAAAFLPSAMRNPIEAALWSQRGVMTSNAEVILTPDQLRPSDLINKAFGFNPTRVAKSRELVWRAKLENRRVDGFQARFRNRWVLAKTGEIEAIKRGDAGRVTYWRRRMNDVVKDMQEFNVGQPENLRVKMNLNEWSREAMRNAYPEARLQGFRIQHRRRVGEILRNNPYVD